MRKQPDFSESIKALKKDNKMAAVVKKYGPLDLTRYHANSRGIFPAILRSIVYQQISGKAAASILGRLLEIFDGRPTPEALLKLPA